MLTSPSFWVLVSFVLFIGLVYKPIWGFITRALDARSVRIKEELDEAIRLREEAQRMLISYQRKQREILDEAADILNAARYEAEKITANASRELEQAVNKRIEMAMQKIAQAEAGALQDVQENAVQIAIRASREILSHQVDSALAGQLVQHSLDEMQRKFH